ncbi:hypothetical protein [Candidatus Atelocyanobacterium thalassae]|uniref:hypothetical protein n=1 Tax=Candidatus Atelocyanobacterium thalassae TaxID=713887 RepID=UPI001E3596E8|nr:hypothetical protein [Candidatus Atelocyanobacterium thalassa]
MFRISPLIQITLISLYISLTIPLPFLSEITDASISDTVLWIGIIVGGLILIGTLSERVIVDEDQIKITYPIWFPFFFRKNWSLSWTEVKDLKLRTTGQGGSVYYLTSNSIDKAYLLPTRVENFAHLIKFITKRTGIDTSEIRPLSQPWMYIILLFCTLLLLLVDSMVIWEIIFN